MTRELPSSGGSYERTKSTGKLTQKEGTKPAEVIKPKPDAPVKPTPEKDA